MMASLKKSMYIRMKTEEREKEEEACEANVLKETDVEKHSSDPKQSEILSVVGEAQENLSTQEPFDICDVTKEFQSGHQGSSAGIQNIAEDRKVHAIENVPPDYQSKNVASHEVLSPSGPAIVEYSESLSSPKEARADHGQDKESKFIWGSGFIPPDVTSSDKSLVSTRRVKAAPSASSSSGRASSSLPVFHPVDDITSRIRRLSIPSKIPSLSIPARRIKPGKKIVSRKVLPSSAKNVTTAFGKRYSEPSMCRGNQRSQIRPPIDYYCKSLVLKGLSSSPVEARAADKPGGTAPVPPAEAEDFMSAKILPSTSCGKAGPYASSSSKAASTSLESFHAVANVASQILRPSVALKRLQAGKKPVTVELPSSSAHVSAGFGKERSAPSRGNQQSELSTINEESITGGQSSKSSSSTSSSSSTFSFISLRGPLHSEMSPASLKTMKIPLTVAELDVLSKSGSSSKRLTVTPPVVESSESAQSSSSATDVEVYLPEYFEIPNLDPFDSRNHEFFLEMTENHFSQWANCYTDTRALRTIYYGKTIIFGGEVCTVVKFLGKGGFASVVQAERRSLYETSGKRSTVALKIGCLDIDWEFYICSELHARHASSAGIDVTNSIPKMIKFLSLPDYHMLMTEVCSFGNLVDLINSYINFDEFVPEPMVMFLCFQLLSIVYRVHELGVLHGDLKPDNFMIAEVPSPEEAVADLWIRTQCVRLIDFGRGVDLTLFSPKTAFRTGLRVSGLTRSLEHSPFRYEVDWFCVCGTVYALLFGEYLQVCANEDGLLMPVRQFNRFWFTKELWEPLFRELLNLTLSDGEPDIMCYLEFIASKLNPEDLRLPFLKLKQHASK